MAVKDSISNLNIPTNRRYSREHFWIYTEGKDRRFGIMGVTEVISRRFVLIHEINLPKNIRKVTKGEIIGSITGTSAFDNKTLTIPLPSLLTGVVFPYEESLKNRLFSKDPFGKILIDPYGDGTLLSILGESQEEIEDLMDAEAYRLYLHQQVKEDQTYLYHHKEIIDSNTNLLKSKGVFICYRRDDTSAWATRLVKRIEQYHSNLGVYLDVATNLPGQDYRQVIKHFLKNVDIVVVLIGPNFFRIADNSGYKRLFKENDPVRTEIRISLTNKKFVCPLLVDGAVHPGQNELPEDIRDLAFRHSFTVQSDGDLDEFVALLKPEILKAHNGEIPKSGEYSIPGVWKTYRDNSNDFARIRSEITIKLLQIGWLLDSRVGEGNLSNPNFLLYRIRFEENQQLVCLDLKKHRRWRKDVWLQVYSWPASYQFTNTLKQMSLPPYLLQAGINPEVFLNKIVANKISGEFRISN